MSTWDCTCSVYLYVYLEFSITKMKKKVMKERLNGSSSICRAIVCNWGLTFKEDFLMGLPLEQRAEGSLVEVGTSIPEEGAVCGIGAERGPVWLEQRVKGTVCKMRLQR